MAQVERKRKTYRNQERLLYLGGSPRVLLHFNTTMEIEGTGSMLLVSVWSPILLHHVALLSLDIDENPG